MGSFPAPDYSLHGAIVRANGWKCVWRRKCACLQTSTIYDVMFRMDSHFREWNAQMIVGEHIYHQGVNSSILLS